MNPFLIINAEIKVQCYLKEILAPKPLPVNGMVPIRKAIQFGNLIVQNPVIH